MLNRFVNVVIVSSFTYVSPSVICKYARGVRLHMMILDSNKLTEKLVYLRSEIIFQKIYTCIFRVNVSNIE